MRLAGRQWWVILAVVLGAALCVWWWWWGRGHDVRIAFARFQEVNGRRWAVFTVDNRSGVQISYMTTTYLYRVPRESGWETKGEQYGGGQERALQHGESGEFYAEINPAEIAGPFQAGLSVWHPPSMLVMVTPDVLVDKLPDALTRREPAIYWSEVVRP
jgi:hypothetical protein